MAKKIKEYFNTDCARLLASKLKTANPGFKSDDFIAFIKRNLRGKEFSARLELYVDAFDEFLSGNYKKDITLFSRILGPELENTTGMFKEGYWLWPISRYVERHGTQDVELSLSFIGELTRRSTGEFAIRPILEQDPRYTMQVMVRWSKDENVHVRRLASEGMRIRLPWAKKSLAAVKQFKLFQKVLHNLKSDPENYVQKSVANNLNDLIKEDPDAAHAIIKGWQADNPGPETRWIIKHALRNVQKK